MSPDRCEARDRHNRPRRFNSKYRSTTAPPLSATAPPQLAGLNSAELTEILDSLTVEPATTVSGEVTLDDLNAEQLTQLLKLMEG